MSLVFFKILPCVNCSPETEGEMGKYPTPWISLFLRKTLALQTRPPLPYPNPPLSVVFSKAADLNLPVNHREVWRAPFPLRHRPSHRCAGAGRPGYLHTPDAADQLALPLVTCPAAAGSTKIRNQDTTQEVETLAHGRATHSKREEPKHTSIALLLQIHSWPVPLTEERG